MGTFKEHSLYHKTSNLAGLKRQILGEFQLITPQMIYNTIQKFYFQLAHDQAAQFEFYCIILFFMTSQKVNLCFIH